MHRRLEHDKRAGTVVQSTKHYESDYLEREREQYRVTTIKDRGLVAIDTIKAITKSYICIYTHDMMHTCD